MSEQIDNEIESSVVSVPNMENEVEITNGDAKVSDPQTPTSAIQPPQLAPPPPNGPPPEVPPQPPAPPQPPPQTSEVEICKDSMRGNCVRSVCKYKHQDPKPIFCHNFQNNYCAIYNCKYTHGTIKDELYYNTHGVLPPHLIKTNEDTNKSPSSKPTCSPSNVKPSVKSTPRFPNIKRAANRGLVPRNIAPNPPPPRVTVPETVHTGFHNYPLIIDPSVPPPFPAYCQPADAGQNSYAGGTPLDFNAIKHTQPPKIFKQNANSTETNSSGMSWENFNRKGMKNDNIDSIGAVEVGTKTYSSPNDLEEPSTKKIKFSNCEACIKLNERYEEKIKEYKAITEMRSKIEKEKNDLICHILKLIVETNSLMSKNREIFQHIFDSVEPELLVSMPKIDVNLHSDSNNTTSSNVMHSEIIASKMDSLATNPMLSNFMTNDISKVIFVNQQGQPVGNAMGPNEYLCPGSMTNKNSYPSFPYNAQKNHNTPTATDVPTTNPNQPFTQYILQGKNIPPPYVNTYGNMRT